MSYNRYVSLTQQSKLRHRAATLVKDFYVDSSSRSVSSPARLVAVVVTHNRLVPLQQTLARLLATPDPYLEAIIVVDNASKEETRTWLAGVTDPRVVVETLSKNLGGAGGFYHGMRVATETFDPDWLCLMDDDARPHEGAFETFLSSERPETSYAAAVYFPEGDICEMNRPGKNPFWHRSIFARTALATLMGRGRFGFHISDDAYTAPEMQEVDNASFVGFFVSRAGVALAGYPDKDLFIYGDDVMYSLHLRAAGGRILFDPQIGFEHACTTFATEGYSVLKPIWKVYYIYRNGLWTYKLASGWLFWLILPLFLTKWILKGRFYKTQRRVYFRLLWQALKDGLFRRKIRSHKEICALADRD